MIFNTSIEASDPIYVIRAEEFGGYVDSDIPIVIGYNQVHYESLHPASEEDIEKTKELINSYISGGYEFKKSDIAFLVTSASEQNESKNAQQSKMYFTYNEDFPPIQVSTKKINVTNERRCFF